MTIASLDTAIQAAEREFARLNSGRWQQVFRVRPGTSKPQIVPAMRYCQFDQQAETRLVELAETISRLMRFKAHLFAKQYALDSRD